MPLIEAKNLEMTYQTGEVATRVLRGMSFSIDAKEFVAIMGPSGSGKSTLLHILGFLDKQTKGTYLFAGKTFRDHSDDEIALVRNTKMGFVFQQFNLLPRTSVVKNVKLPLLYSNVPEGEWQERALRAVHAVGLGHRVEHETSQLSGGEKQRVAIARALVNNPEVIFADEPTGNLDSHSGETVMDIIQKLNDEGQTIILITHESYAAGYADRVIKIRDGEIESDSKNAQRHKKGDGYIK